MSAYRPELLGILANIAFLQLATIELNKIVSDPTHLVDPIQTDYDLLLEIQGALLTFPLHITVKWIRGHQEDNAAQETLDFIALLNINYDRRAKEYLKANVGASLLVPLILHHEKWGAIWGNHKITTDLKNAMFEHSLTAQPQIISAKIF